MKSNLLRLFTYFIIASVAFTACKDSKKKEEVKEEIPALYKELPGTLISKNTTWAGEMNLEGPQYVLPGVTLTIEAGTVIKFAYHNNDPNKVGMLITLAGDETNFTTPRATARVLANGTAVKPIVFTSSRTSPQAGDIGGIILIGRAYNNIPGSFGEVEGLPNSVQYGGGTSPKNDDDSGILRYVRVEYSGFGLTADSEVNAVTFYSVGSKTTIEYVQIYKCTDDGFEWFGGSVDAKYLISTYADDDMFDFDQGYNGRGQFWLGVQSAGADNGFEYDGRKNLGEGIATNPTLYNVTLVGLGSGKDASDKNYGMRLREDAEGTLKNFVITDFVGLNWKLEGRPGASDEADVTYENYGTKLILEDFIVFNNGGWNQDDATRYASSYEEVNPGFTNTAAFDFTRGNVSDGSTPPNDGFFVTSAKYRGAFASTNWTAGWTRWND